jgi:hypothetical protein
MVKQTWDINENERFRILKLHESATKNLYLINEQKVVTKKLEPKKFTLPNNTFQSGKYKEFDKNAVDNIIKQVNDYVKDYPQNQQIKLEIESSESKVPNKGVGLKTGELSEKRAKEMAEYLKGKLPSNIILTIKNLGDQGPGWNPPKNATSEQIKRLASDPRYTQWQYVSFNVIGSGEKTDELCELGFSVIVDYQKEWCTKFDQSRCHKCDNAIFYMYANGIPLRDEKGSPNINLNNNIGSEMSGPSRVVKLVINSEQKKQILEKNPNEIIITYSCALDDCHSDPAHITILSDNGQVLLPGTFFTTGGVRMSKRNPPIKLMTLNKCGELISSVVTDKKDQQAQQAQEQKWNQELTKVGETEGLILLPKYNNSVIIPEVFQVLSQQDQGNYYVIKIKNISNSSSKIKNVFDINRNKIVQFPLLKNEEIMVRYEKITLDVPRGSKILLSAQKEFLKNNPDVVSLDEGGKYYLVGNYDIEIPEKKGSGNLVSIKNTHNKVVQVNFI